MFVVFTAVLTLVGGFLFEFCSAENLFCVVTLYSTLALFADELADDGAEVVAVTLVERTFTLVC